MMCIMLHYCYFVIYYLFFVIFHGFVLGVVQQVVIVDYIIGIDKCLKVTESFLPDADSWSVTISEKQTLLTCLLYNN